MRLQVTVTVAGEKPKIIYQFGSQLMKTKRFLSVLLAAIMVLSMFAMSASAYDSTNTFTRDLSKPYSLSGTHQDMEYQFGYGTYNIWSQTKIQAGMGPATGKAYTAFVPRQWFGLSGKQYQKASYSKDSKGYITVTAKSGESGDPNGKTDGEANTVMHSGYTNVTIDWRVDRKYERK